MNATSMYNYMDKYGNSKWGIDIDLSTTNKYIYMDKYSRSDIDIWMQQVSIITLTNTVTVNGA